MGNICPWCRKNPEDLDTNNSPDERTRLISSQHFSSSEADDRTSLNQQSGNSRQNNRNSATSNNSLTGGGEASSILNGVVPPPPPPKILADSQITGSGKSGVLDNDESSMTGIADRLLPDLIDVGDWGATMHQPNKTNSNSNPQNDHLRQLVSKSFHSTRLSMLPDAGVTNLSTLLSGRPISAGICHYVTHTAGELSRLLIDEIKIVHKEDLVVTFE